MFLAQWKPAGTLIWSTFSRVATRPEADGIVMRSSVFAGYDWRVVVAADE